MFDSVEEKCLKNYVQIIRRAKMATCDKCGKDITNEDFVSVHSSKIHEGLLDIHEVINFYCTNCAPVL